MAPRGAAPLPLVLAGDCSASSRITSLEKCDSAAVRWRRRREWRLRGGDAGLATCFASPPVPASSCSVAMPSSGAEVSSSPRCRLRDDALRLWLL